MSNGMADGDGAEITAHSAVIVRSPTHDTIELKRMLWRCRRGLLELDIMLKPFVAHQYATLSEPELFVFEALLDMPDNLLWDMMSGRIEVENAEQQALLEKIKSA